MKEIDFYSGFEGEPAAVLYGGDEIIYIWDGYFTPIMEAVLDIEVREFGSAFGIVSDWNCLTGWCEDSEKHRIENLDTEIDAFSRLDWKMLNIDDDRKNICQKVYDEILKLFGKAKEQGFDVYIQED